MMKKIIFLLFILSIVIISGCSKKQGDTLFTTPIANQPGFLINLHTDPYLGSVPMGNTIDWAISFNASGGLDLSNMSASLSGDSTFTFKGGSYPGTGGTCGAKLGSGKNCTIVITYTPTALITNHFSINFTYADSTGNKTLASAMEADSHPILTFQYGTQYDFGNKFVGSSTDLTITITNTGKASANSLSVPNLASPYSFKGGSYPGTGGTCGSSVAVGATCNLVINFSPVNNGQKLQSITLNYTNAGNAESNVLSLTAWGFYPATLTFSDTGTYNFGNIVANLDHDKVYTLTYSSGDVTATSISFSALSAPYTYKGGSFPGTGGTCSTTLTSGSCTVVVTLNSATTATYSSNLIVSYHNGQVVKTFPTVSLQGSIKQKPVVSVSPIAAFDFGLIKTGTSSATKTYTFTYQSGEMSATNVGIDNLSSPFVYAGGTFPGSGGTCTGTLSSGSCTVVVVYSPLSQNTPWQSTVKFSYDDYITRVQQSVTFTGSTEAKLIFSPSSLNFGNRVQTTQYTTSASLTFVGGVPATNITPFVPGIPFAYSGGGAFPGLLGTCGTSLSSGSCTIYFTFSPTDTSNHLYTYAINYDDGFTTQTLNLTLSGTGTAPAFLTIPTTNIGSVSVNDHSYNSVTITNSTLMDATTVSAGALPTGFTFKGGTYPGTGGTCGTTIAAGGSCTLSLTFAPTVAGVASGNITMNYHNGLTNTTTNGSLTGTGTNTNNLYLSLDDTYNFSSRFLNTNNDLTLTLSHGGSASTVTSISGAALPADYSFAGGTFPGTGGTCGTTLAGSSSCTFVIRFSPQTSGTKNTSITINYNNGSARTVARLVTGIGVQQPIITITPATYNYGLQPVNFTYEKTFNVTMIGDFPALSWTGDMLGSGFTFKGGSYPGTGGTCSSSYTGPCTIVVIFSPTTTIAYSGTVRIRYDDYLTWQYATATLSGTGKGAALLSYTSASPYNFGTTIQTSSTDATLTINNSGSVDATSISGAALTAPFSYKGGTFPGTGGTCTATLTAGSSCTIIARYTPTSTGSSSGTLTVNYNNGTSATTNTLSLSGTAVTQAVLILSDTNPYTYGSVVVGSTTSKIFTITNGGASLATINSSTFPAQFGYKGGTFPGTGGTCTTSIAAYSNCTVVVNYSPTGLGAASGTYTINYNDGLGAQVEFKTLMASGIAALLAGNFMQMIPIKQIDTTAPPEIFFEEALITNGDQVKLSNGSVVTGIDELIITKGKATQYLQMLDGNIDASSDLSAWGLSKINLGDINNDGIDDFVVSYFDPNLTTTINDQITFTAISGKDLSTIYGVSVPNPNHYILGLSSIPIPQDIDRDGHNEFITGLYQLDSNNHLILKDFIIFSSKTGRPIDYQTYLKSLTL